MLHHMNQVDLLQADNKPVSRSIGEGKSKLFR